MGGQKQRSMRNLLINKSAQGPVILIVLLCGFVCSAFNGVLYYIYVKESYDVIFVDTTFPQFLVQARYDDLLNFGLVLVVLSLTITVVTALFALAISHRAAGACYRLQAVIEEIKAGNMDARVHLRQKDEFQELAQSFNEMMDGLSK